MNIKTNKFNPIGLTHHFLVALVAITIVASIGAYYVFFSKAATSFNYDNVDHSQLFSATTPDGCWLAGRVWEPKTTTTGKGNNKKTIPPHCTQKCRYGGDATKNGALPSYCPKALAPDITPAVCINELHRRFVHNVGCARRVDNKDTNGASQCIPGYPNYNERQNLPDICVANLIPKAQTSNAHANAPAAAPAAKPTPARPAQPAQNPARPAQPAQNAVNPEQPAQNAARPAQPAQNANNQANRPNQVNNRTGNNNQARNNRPNNPKCSNGTTPDRNGKCKQEIVRNPAPATVVVAVNKKINKKDCLLLGREWQPGNNQGQPQGCSKVSCNNSADKIAVNAGKTVCVDSATNSMYAVHLGKNVCNNLKRQWIDEVNLCAKLPNNGSPTSIVSAAQCKDSFTTYTIKSGKPDECFKPTAANRVSSAVKSTTKIVKNTAQLGPKAACNLNKNTYWNDGKCKKKRVSKGKQKSHNNNSSESETEDEEGSEEDESSDTEEAYDVDDVCGDDTACSSQVEAEAASEAATQDTTAATASQSDNANQESSENTPDTSNESDSSDEEVDSEEYADEYTDTEEYSDSEDDTSYDEYGECVDESSCSDEEYYEASDDVTEGPEQEDASQPESEDDAEDEEASTNNDNTSASKAFIEPEKDPTVIVPVSNNLSKYQCISLLGREWVKSTTNGQQEGCSMKTCHDSKDKLSKESSGKYCISTKYGSAYGTISVNKQECAKLNRKYIVPVNVCAQNPNQNKPGKALINADQCIGKYSTYLVGKDTADRCVLPSSIQKVRGVFSKTGNIFNKIYSIGPSTICKTKDNHYWDGQNCKVMRRMKAKDRG